MKFIYLDYAAATPMDPDVLAAMQPYFSKKFFNASATYLAGRAVAKDIEKARANVAKWLGARPAEIIFTAGGTEANNLAIQGVMQEFPAGNVIVSSVEHDSVLKPAANYQHKIAKVNAEGLIDLNDLKFKIDDQTVLVSIMYANNEIGTIEPIKEISNLLSEIHIQRRQKGNKLPLYFHTDACQAGAYLSLQANRLGIDLMTLNGGKIYGPKQSGALYVKTGTQLKPQILGGGQERGLRSGTQNTAAIIGFSKALDIVQKRRQKDTARLSKLQALFINLLTKEIPGSIINGSLKHRLPNNVHITLPGIDNERVMMQLDEQGIICAVGSACSASSKAPSHVLTALGIGDEQAQSSLRFSMGKETNQADVKQTVNALKMLV